MPAGGPGWLKRLYDDVALLMVGSNRSGRSVIAEVRTFPSRLGRPVSTGQ